ncbi:MAG TPA: hypothetical protein VNQ73_19470 [Ilumatobacter sp.]|nr:hypothetical protein [Ilumatobacter sp.]
MSTLGLQFRSREDVSPVDVEVPKPSSEPARAPKVRSVRPFVGGVGPDAPEGPQAVLIEDYPPYGVTRSHFHAVDQYHIFFGSEGSWYQRSPIPALGVHYADAYATYGPFGTDEVSLTFFALRATPSRMIAYMPESRDQLKYRGRRHAFLDVGEALVLASNDEESQWTDLIQEHDDGLHAEVARMAPGASIDLPPLPDPSPGRYIFIAAGDLVQGDMHHAEGCLAWDPGDVPAGPLYAGARGCNLLVLQMPQCTVPSEYQ